MGREPNCTPLLERSLLIDMFSCFRSSLKYCKVAGVALCSVLVGVGTAKQLNDNKNWKALCQSRAAEVAVSTAVREEESADRLTLYQYRTCPFCRKVAAYLNYYGIEHTVVEVNPVMRGEIKFSQYKKVPIVVVERGERSTQLNDSSVIISALQTLRTGQHTDMDQVVQYFPTMKVKKGNREVTEYLNRYEVMHTPQSPAYSLEKKWRLWVDDVFVHMLSPNVYRTPSEALQAFEYISKVGNFGSFEKLVVRYVGAAGMYFVSKKLKKKYSLKADVRESLYDSGREWTKAVGSQQFLGGDNPNLADLSVYGVLSAIEGLDAFRDLMDQNKKMNHWYQRTKDRVLSHSGGTA